MTQYCVKLSAYVPMLQVETHLLTKVSANVGYLHSYSQYPVEKSPKVFEEQVWVQFPVNLSIK